MRYEYLSGSYYEGNMIDEKFEGEGTFYFINGDIYKGRFDNDMFNGHGEYHYKSGMKYIGNFENDEFDGLGTLSLGANCIERGKFQKGKRVGKFYQMDNNEYYLIVYNNNKMERFEKIMRERIPEDKFPKF